MQKAQSELAYELQASITKQKIKEEEMQIKVVERAQQINVQEQVNMNKLGLLNLTVVVCLATILDKINGTSGPPLPPFK